MIAPSSIQLAYLAGIIDSDGHITIHKSVRKGVSYYAPVIGISGTRCQPHELAASIWGGKIWPHQPKNPRHRRFFVWARQGRSAIPIIQSMLPYLLVKRERADLALSLYDMVDNNYMGAARQKMILLLNQDRRRPLTNAVEHNGFPS